MWLGGQRHPGAITHDAQRPVVSWAGVFTGSRLFAPPASCPRPLLCRAQ